MSGNATESHGETARPERDEKGRFVKGNGGGPGNPFARQVAEFRKAAVAACTPEKVAAVLLAMEKKALEGDVAAARVWLAYTVGRPAAAVDPDTLDVEEAELIWQDVAARPQVMASMMQPVLSLFLQLAGLVRPAATDRVRQYCGEQMQKMEAKEARKAGAKARRAAKRAEGRAGPEQKKQLTQEEPSGNGGNGGGSEPVEVSGAWPVQWVESVRAVLRKIAQESGDAESSTNGWNGDWSEPAGNGQGKPAGPGGGSRKKRWKRR